MLESRKLLRGTAVLTTGRMAGYVLSFLRNLILARMLAKADYGLASVFGTAMALLEVSGNMAFGMQIIQSKQGDTYRFQASAHALMFLGGLCSAALLVGLSVPMAHLFRVPHIWWAFALLGVVPMCQGLGHLDVARRQREFDYVPSVAIELASQFLITAAAWPLTVWFGDYRAIVCLMIGKAVSSTAMTYSFARRPYRWAWEREQMRSMLSFGWPLLLTGLLMFGSQQADQMLVGSAFSLAVLAEYGLAFSVVSVPWFMFGQVASALMLPLMSRAQDDPVRLRRQYRVCVQLAAVAGVLFNLPLIVAGEQLITLVFGAKYHGTGAFVALLGAAFAVRFLRYAPAEASMAKADTLNQFYSNLWRGASLPLALVVWRVGGTPVQIAGCAVVGEVLAAVFSVVNLWRRHGVPLRESYVASAYLFTLMSAGLGFALVAGKDLTIGWAAAAAIGAFSMALGVAWFMFPEVARLIIDTFRRHALGSHFHRKPQLC